MPINLYDSGTTQFVKSEPVPNQQAIRPSNSQIYGSQANPGRVATLLICFRQSAGLPPTPVGGNFNFDNNVFTPPDGWLSLPIQNPSSQVWFSIAYTISANTTLDWSPPAPLASPDSGLGILSGTGFPSNDLGINNQLYVQIDTTPAILYFKINAAWRLVGGGGSTRRTIPWVVFPVTAGQLVFTDPQVSLYSSINANVVRNGVILDPYKDYTINGDTLYLNSTIITTSSDFIGLAPSLVAVFIPWFGWIVQSGTYTYSDARLLSYNTFDALVTLNGVVLDPTLYTITSNTITLAASTNIVTGNFLGIAPSSTNVNTPTITFISTLNQHTFTGGAVSNYTTYNAIVNINGVVLQPDQDYTIAGNTLTINASIQINAGNYINIASSSQGGDSGGLPILQGYGVPPTYLGQDGQLYVDVTVGGSYQTYFKTSGSWNLIAGGGGSGGAIYFDSPGSNYIPVTVAGNAVENPTTFNGSVSSIVLQIEGVGTASSLKALFDANGTAILYRFSGDLTTFAIASTAVTTSSTVTVTLGVATLFLSTIQPLTNLQIQQVVATQFTDVSLTAPLTGSVATGPTGRATLTLGSAATAVNVNGVTVPNANFQDNPLFLGTGYMVSAGNIVSAVRDGDVTTVANRQIALNIGSITTTRGQISNGPIGDAVLIQQDIGAVRMSIEVVTNAAAIVNMLNNLGAQATTISNVTQGGNTLLVASWGALAFQVVANFPITTTIATVRALFNGVRSDNVFFGGPLTGVFVYDVPPKQAINRQILAGTNITTTTDANNDLTINAANSSLNFELPEIWNNATIAAGNITLASAQAAGSLINIQVTAGAGNASAVASFITQRLTTQRWRFVGSAATFFVASNSTSGDVVTLNFTAPFNLDVALPAGAQLQFFVSIGALQPFTRIAAGTNVTASVAPDASNQPTLTINSTGGGGGSATLQGLTDTQFTEPVYTQVGTATVVSVTANIFSINVSSAIGLSVGDWLRGSTTTPGQLPAIQVIFITGNLVEFSFDPTPFFAVGNNIYRLPATLQGSSLFFSNAQNKWVAEPPNSTLPLDTLDWVNLGSDIFVTDVTVPIFDSPVTTNTAILSGPWSFPLATLPFLSMNEIVGVDTFGRMVSGEYISAADSGTATAILQNPLVDRRGGGGFAINQAYTMSWRQGRFALADYVRFTPNTTNIIQGNAAVAATADTEIASLVGALPTVYTAQGVGSVTTGFGNAGTTWQARTTDYAAAVIALQTTGATRPAVQPGSWTLPAWTIRISNLANPTATQFATITSIQENPTNSILLVTFAGNPAYFANAGLSSQPLFTLLGRYGFVQPPRDEIIRLAQVNTVSSLNALTGAVTLAGSTSVSIAEDPNTRTLTFSSSGGSQTVASNLTTYDSTQDPDNPMYVNQTSQGAIANAILIGMPLRQAAAFDQNSTGGVIGGVTYVSSGNTVAQRGISFPVSATPLPEFRVVVTFGAFIIDVTYTSNLGGDATQGDIAATGAWFSQASLTSGNDPRINSNLFSQFNNGQGGNMEGRQLSPFIPPYVISRVPQGTPTTATATYRYTISASTWQATGFGGNYVGSNTEYHPYLELDEVDTGVFISNCVWQGQGVGGQPTTGGIEIILGLQPSGGLATPTLQQVVSTGNTSTLPIIYQDESAPAKSVSLGPPVSVGTSYIMRLPASQGLKTSLLRNDGVGNLSWQPNWTLMVITARKDKTIPPVLNVSATFSTPPATTLGTVSVYNYFSAGAFTTIYRFSPNTDSTTSLSYSSFWSTFTGNTTLSGLIVQRGQL